MNRVAVVGLLVPWLALAQGVPPTAVKQQVCNAQGKCATITNGKLDVNVTGGGGGADASVGTTGSTVPGSASYVGVNVGGNLTGLAGTANGLKVDGSAVTQPMSAAALPLPAGAAQDATLTGGSQKTQVVNGANALAIDGSGRPTVNVAGTVPVSGTFWQATQPVSGTFWQATQPVSIASMPSTPVTGTFWQATQPVSGTVTANAGSGTFTTSDSKLPSGLTAPTSAPAGTEAGLITRNIPSGTQAVSGTVTANAGSGTMATSSTQLPGALDGSGYLKTHEQGTANVNVTNASIPVTGTFWQATQPVSASSLPLPSGAATETTLSAMSGKLPSALGPQASASSLSVTPATGATFPVSGTFWQATQPISGTVTATQATGSNLHVTVDSAPTTAVTGTFWQATQPVSGTVTANQGTANATPWNENLAQVGGSAVATAATGVAKVGIVGNAGAAVDAPNNGTAPANVTVDGYEAQSSALGSSATAGNVRRGVVGLDGVLYVRPGSPLLFSGGVTAIAATLTQIVAAPAAGTSLYLTDIVASSDTATAGQMTFRYGTGSNCATGTTTVLPNVASVTTGKIPYPGNTAAYPSIFHFSTPIKLPAANALCIICVATNTCTVTASGFTAP